MIDTKGNPDEIPELHIHALKKVNLLIKALKAIEEVGLRFSETTAKARQIRTAISHSLTYYHERMEK